MAMTKKNYVAIASLINDYLEQPSMQVSFDDLVNNLSDYFQKDNPNFDPTTFKKACYKST